MARKLRISTPYGNVYYVHDDGAIERADGHNGKGSQSWLFLGLQHVKRSEFIRFEDLTPARLASLVLKWKNGKPQYTVRDRDHGTVRTWGNTAYHGVSSVTFEAA